MVLERVRFVTEHYNELHGLRWIAWGFVCFAVAAEDSGALATWVMLAVILPLGLALFVGASAYYLRTYGIVMPISSGGIGLGMLNLAVIALLVLSFIIDERMQVRPFVQPFVFAAWFLVTFWWSGRAYRGYYLWIALAMAAANILLSFVDFEVGSVFLRRGVVTWGLAGLAMIAGGIGDHLLIVNTFSKPRAAHE